MSQPRTTIATVDHGHDFSPLHARIQTYIDREVLPCCNLLVMRGTDVLDFRTFGYLDLESRRPLPVDGIFRMYSNTKLVTSVAAMMLCDQGKLGLDDPLSDYLPAFANMRVLVPHAQTIDDTEPARDAIRIRHLLSHTAGLSYGFMEPDSIIDRAYAERGIHLRGDSAQTLASFCDALASMPLVHHPGMRWRYSFASEVVGRVLEVVSGKPFDAFLKTALFMPLGMNDTDFWVPPAKRDRFVTMYTPADITKPMEGGLRKLDDPHTGAFTTQSRVPAGGSGLVSTAPDYLAFIRMLVSGGSADGVQYLKPETLQLMRESQLPAGMEIGLPRWPMPGTAFGLGFAVKQTLAEGDPNTALGEYSWSGMAGTHTWFAPGPELTIMCMTQLLPGYGHPYAMDIWRFAHGLAASWQRNKTPPADGVEKS